VATQLFLRQGDYAIVEVVNVAGAVEGIVESVDGLIPGVLRVVVANAVIVVDRFVVIADVGVRAQGAGAGGVVHLVVGVVCGHVDQRRLLVEGGVGIGGALFFLLRSVYLTHAASSPEPPS